MKKNNNKIDYSPIVWNDLKAKYKIDNVDEFRYARTETRAILVMLGYGITIGVLYSDEIRGAMKALCSGTTKAVRKALNVVTGKKQIKQEQPEPAHLYPLGELFGTNTERAEQDD